MILIAHRGNYNSVQPDRENTLSYLHEAISHGYNVEVDIRLTNEGFMLGHDAPAYLITKSQITEISEYAWFHAKNYEALVALTEEGHHVFAHDQDPWALTSRNVIWSHNHHYNPKGIVCMPDVAVDSDIILAATGVCHDRLDWIERLLESNMVR
jgi:glycerophosphoryl diester phosphodiesterase